MTHFMDEAERLCDRLVVIQEGVVVAGGTPPELVRDHDGGLTATFTADDVALAALAALAGLPG